MLLALLALVIALGGTSYAVSKLPKNSVGTQQLRDGAVTTPKLAKGAAARIAGFKIAKVTLTATPKSGMVVTVPAPAGLTVIGGGVETPHTGNSWLDDSHPVPNGWEATVIDGSDVPETVTVYAICAKVESGQTRVRFTNAAPTIHRFALHG
jgi:hypothetical protein